MHLKELCKQAHQIAKSKGFWDKNKNIPEKIMLCVTELAEAVEALRKNNRQISDKEWSKLKITHLCNENTFDDRWTKDSFEDEICDTFIRLADLCEYMNIDIEWQIKKKMEYNKSREKLHGKKF